MLRLRNLSNKFQKRTVRVEYNQHRAQPFAGVLDSSLGVSGSGFTNPGSVFTYQSGLVPGTVMVHDYAGDSFQVATGANSALQPFGLLGNFVGGTLDELGDQNSIGVWNGVGSTYTLLAPAFNDGSGVTPAGGANVATTNVANLATAAAAATAGNPVLLYACTDGRLAALTTPGSRVAVAQLLERVSASVIRVRLLV